MITIILLIVASYLLICGLFGLAQNVEGFLLELLGGVGVLGLSVLSVIWRDKKAEDAEAAAEEDFSVKYYSCSLAGVTIGGRQDILRKMYLDGEADENGCVPFDSGIEIQPFSGGDEVAFSVLCGGKKLGDIPDESIADMKLICERICDKKILIGWTRDNKKKQRIYNVKLYVSYI